MPLQHSGLLVIAAGWGQQARSEPYLSEHTGWRLREESQMRQLWAFGITLGGAIGVIGAVEVLAGKLKLLGRGAARKVMHIATGLIYACTFPNYPSSAGSRWLCASVPALMVVRFAAVGLGLLKDQKLVEGATRHGVASELLSGPCFYGLAHAWLCASYWRESPAGLVGIAALCAGDGMAEVIGRRYGKTRLPFNPAKTWAGTVACAVSSWVASVALLTWFKRQGHLQQLEDHDILRGAACCSLVAAVTEALPLGIDGLDNLAVPLAVALVAHNTSAFGNKDHNEIRSV